MKNVIFVTLTLLTLSCRENLDLQENILADYLQLNANRELADLVACAGGKADGWLGLSSEPTDVLFYPIQGATDFRYFEAESIADSSNFSKYIAKDLNSEPVFNGYLWKFNNTAFSGERIGIVTYKTPGKIHVCSPIRLKTNVKPTEVNSDLVEIIENGTTPSFIWEDGLPSATSITGIFLNTHSVSVATYSFSSNDVNCFKKESSIIDMTLTISPSSL